MLTLPPSAEQYGFILSGLGAHSSRTIMLAELRLLLSATPLHADPAAVESAIVHDNVLLKRTASTRRESFRRLREMYGLDTRIPLFRALFDLWHLDPDAQALLALLCAIARDPVLRSTAGLVLATPVGDRLTPQEISAAVASAHPDRLNATTLANIGRHAASSWQQSGHLAGRLSKVRTKPQCHPPAVAYALFLGYLCGQRGEALFDTFWAQLLDAPPHSLHDQAFAASQRGLLEYRHSGTVTDISFRHLLRDEV